MNKGEYTFGKGCSMMENQGTLMKTINDIVHFYRKYIKKLATIIQAIQHKVKRRKD